MSEPIMPGDVLPGAITTADLYRELSGINTKLAVFAEQVRSNTAAGADHEARIRVLERFRFTLLGASMTVGTMAGVLSSVLVAWLQRH